jgi:hypothetical protein
LKLAYNPSCSGVGDQSGRSRYEASLGKKLARPSSQQKKLAMVAHACYPSYMISVNKRIPIQNTSLARTETEDLI